MNIVILVLFFVFLVALCGVFLYAVFGVVDELDWWRKDIQRRRDYHE